MKTRLPHTVIVLGVVSFLTDFSSDMIYPLLPVFLSSVLGAGAVALGVIEGIAESAASLLKLASGIWTDRLRRRKPFLIAGYGLAGAARPLIGLAATWPFVLFMRFLDRVGKGLRASPRDALIADVTDARQRGAAFGLHRAMDHAGAVAGPLTAAALLSIPGVSLRGVFLLAAVPAAAVMLVLLLLLKEKRSAAPSPDESGGASGGAADEPRSRLAWLGWGSLSPQLRLLLAAVFVFTLGNSTDAFLLLRLKEAGLPAASLALLWALHHVVRMVSTYAGGRLADRAGRRRLVLSGWAFYAAVYLAFGWARSSAALVAIFLAYGIYFGLTEPAEKAWVADLAPAGLRGRAFGFYNLMIGLGALPASLLFGLLWQAFGPIAAFTTGAAFAMLASILLLVQQGRRAAGP
jgi:MFS family permease